jgi:hypothetical protein
MACGVNRFASPGVLVAAFVAFAACDKPTTPPTGPESICATSCKLHVPVCAEEGCWRGCNLILDRLAEHEGDNVIACVAKTAKVCDDHAWAHCAARVGIHADGGPPAPPPPKDIEDVDQDQQEQEDQL